MHHNLILPTDDVIHARHNIHLDVIAAISVTRNAAVGRRIDRMEDGFVDAAIKVLGLDDFVDVGVLGANGIERAEVVRVGFVHQMSGQAVDLDDGQAIAGHAVFISSEGGVQIVRRRFGDGVQMIMGTHPGDVQLQLAGDAFLEVHDPVRFASSDLDRDNLLRRRKFIIIIMKMY